MDVDSVQAQINDLQRRIAAVERQQDEVQSALDEGRSYRGMTAQVISRVRALPAKTLTNDGKLSGTRTCNNIWDCSGLLCLVVSVLQVPSIPATHRLQARQRTFIYCELNIVTENPASPSDMQLRYTHVVLL